MMTTTKPRTRIKKAYRKYNPTIGREEPLYQNYLIFNKETFRDSVPGPCSCYHIVHEPVSGSKQIGISYGQPMYLYYDQWFHVLPEEAYIPWTTSFNWNKLKSSSGFSLINFVKELDDTLALFTLKFWREISYGSITWGILPFASDFKALGQAIYNWKLRASQVKYEDTYKVPLPNHQVFFDYQQSGTILDYDIRFQLHVEGKIDYNSLDPILKALDFWAFHPDLATAWDLLPYSFVVDYYTNIGDILSGLQGWIRSIKLEGWKSYKVTYKSKYGKRLTRPGSDYGYSDHSDSALYVREQGNFVLTRPPTPEWQINFPSIKNICNTAYILVGAALSRYGVKM